MSDRITYACASCGASVDQQARLCPFCKAPVATVRCASCFHMNVPDAGFCSGCGRQLGLEPVGEAGTLDCPVCKTPLEMYREHASTPPDEPTAAGEDPVAVPALHDCRRCGGQFVDHHLLREMLHRHEHVAFPEAIARLPFVPDPRSGYIPCPACHALMNRKNFGGASGVIVDVCRKHGTWFDLGELPRVLAFVAGGGLEKSRQREAEEQARAKREALARAAAAEAMMPHAPPSSHGGGFARMFIDILLR